MSAGKLFHFDMLPKKISPMVQWLAIEYCFEYSYEDYSPKYGK